MPMAEELRFQTKAEYAAHTLRMQIRRGELAPGDRIDIEGMATSLRMSETPVREALRLLHAERIVVIEPHRGIHVADLNVDDLNHVYELRAMLEGYATRIATERLTDAELAQLADLTRRHAAAVELDAGEATRLNEEWHYVIYRAATTDGPLIDFIQKLWNHFPWTTSWLVPGRASTSARDHAHILAALEQRDAELAARRMADHIVASKEFVIGHLASTAAQTPS